MAAFKDYLNSINEAFRDALTDDELLNISDTLNTFTEEELDVFGAYLFDTFFVDSNDEETDDSYEETDDSYEETDDSDDRYGVEEIVSMLKVLQFIPGINDFIEDAFDVVDVLAEIDEDVSSVFGASNKNHKKRKFMSNSASELRRTKNARKRSNRENKASRKAYYHKNKVKLAKYQKMRSTAIKKGTHIVKLRRKSG